MNKKELIEEVSAKLNISQKQSAESIAATLDVIRDTVSAGGTVQLVGFGSFKPSFRKARVGRNPQTGEAIQIGEKHTVKFTSAKNFVFEKA